MRLFVAVRPSEDVLDVLAALPRPAERGLRYTRREHWHLTLRFLGDADPELVTDTLAGVDAPTTVAKLGPCVTCLSRNIAVVPVAGVDDLAASVRDTTAELGAPLDRRPFSGHITIARLQRRAVCRIDRAPIDASFTVEEILLVNSELGEGGPGYEIVETFSLS